MSSSTPIRALALLSGGLDSQLAVMLIKKQGIQVAGVAFKSIFFDDLSARKAASLLGIELKVVDFTATIIGLIERPLHGFGAGMNPCIDCHAAMIRQAGEIMRAEGYSFLITGEVLNERPMSQNRRSLGIVAEESGMAGYLLRPLSAKLLEITEPEKNKWVDREQLLAIEGRSRRIQLGLAREMGLADFPQPAGGCLLTDPGYGKRLRDLKKHEGIGDIAAIQLLRTGRHFRLGNLKLVVGRNREENERLARVAVESNMILLRCLSVPGPSALLPRTAPENEIQRAGSVCAKFGDHKPGLPVAIEVILGNDKRVIDALPAAQDEIDALRV